MNDRVSLNKDIAGYYNEGREQDRLLSAHGRVEFLRTQELLRRFLPAPPASVLDTGGGAGIHAFPLAKRGYSIHLIDPVALHVEQARRASESQSDAPLTSASIGDARSLDFADESADAVFLLGPLYHLTSTVDRMQALSEASRVLKHGGVVVTAAISRFASIHDWLNREFVGEEFEDIVDRDLRDGHHENPNARPGWFTTAYFHRPEELREEIANSGFRVEAMVAVEGIASNLSNIEFWLEDESRRVQLMSAIRRVESEPSLLGSSSHLLSVGRKL